MTELNEKVEAMLSGTIALPGPGDMRDMIGQLKGSLDFGRARRLLSTVLAALPEGQRSTSPEAVWLTQQLALCTYKDEELPPASRLDDAMRLLEDIGLRDPGNLDAETLALGGAVCKRRWEHGGQIEFLHESLAFYAAAHERNPNQDMGYGGINAAFICDLLAARLIQIEKRNGIPSAEAKQYHKKAENLRKSVLRILGPMLRRDTSLGRQHWFLATLAEARFGLGEYEEAGRLLEQAAALPDVKEWELQSTFRQLAALADHQNLAPPAAGSDPKDWDAPWQALARLLGEDTAAAAGSHRGRVGLALSGGGFRASLFHLGVLARLAEVDALRSVEVLSTVSGGSIVGAHYYLELQKLLESRPDRALEIEDYIDLVKRVQTQFLQGVQRNVRMTTFANFFDTLRMLFCASYSRSHKLGEVYEELLYRRVKDGRGDKPRHMEQLLVQPASGPASTAERFKPKFENWRRRAKVPILLLNTTSLNSGHNWFFTASWMGEPPGLVGDEIDNNRRYRRLYYREAPNQGLREFRLGHAVAASSCVPGLFEPLVIQNLYPGTSVRLVDGGVHDNQGVQGLLDEGCTLILCSDASGQMADVSDPADDPAGVLLRTVSVLQDRIREAEYQDLQGRLDSRALQGLLFVHSKKELGVAPATWNGGKAKEAASGALPDEPTSYGVNKRLQDSIASLRTDLDAFTDVEAYCLMASGYLMTSAELKVLQAQHLKDGGKGNWGNFAIDATARSDWPFLPLLDLLGEAESGASPRRQDLAFQLKAGSALFLKAWKLVPELKRLATIVGAGVALALVVLIVLLWNAPLFTQQITWGVVLSALLLTFAGLVLPALKWLDPAGESKQIVIKIAIGLTGYVLGKLHLWWIDRLFLERGALSRLLKLDGKST